MSRVEHYQSRLRPLSHLHSLQRGNPDETDGQVIEKVYTAASPALAVDFSQCKDLITFVSTHNYAIFFFFKK